MDELSGKLTQILNDPQQMQQILNLAKETGLVGEEDSIPTDAAQAVSHMSHALQRYKEAGQKQQALFYALRPYLKPDRRTRLDRALQLAKLSHLAEAALRSTAAERGNSHV